MHDLDFRPTASYGYDAGKTLRSEVSWFKSYIVEKTDGRKDTTSSIVTFPPKVRKRHMMEGRHFKLKLPIGILAVVWR